MLQRVSAPLTPPVQSCPNRGFELQKIKMPSFCPDTLSTCSPAGLCVGLYILFQ